MASLTLTDILTAVGIGETQDWEFKSAKGGFPGSFWETYSAMANTEGGVIVLGISEKNGHAHVDGLTSEQAAKYQKQLWDDANNKSTISHNLLSSSDVQLFTIASGVLLAARIPRASRTHQPVYTGPTPFGRTYKRLGEGDYRCPDEVVRRMMADADIYPRDQKILEGFGFEDFDSESVTQYKNRFSARNPNHPWLSETHVSFMEKLGAWRHDRQNSNQGITLAGLLMFGKHLSITDQYAAPDFAVDFREKIDPDVRWTDRLYPDGMWEANLFQFYQRVWPRITRDLKVPFKLDGVERKDETPVHEALREALVNAIIHSDYSAPGGIIIERYKDRFVIINPGTLLVSIDQLKQGGISECRNKSLQKMFSFIGGGEKAGSGYDRIKSGWKSQHWRAPSLSIQMQPDMIKLVLPMQSLIPEETLAVIRDLTGPNFNTLGSIGTQILATAHVEGEVSNSRLQELLEDHPADITRSLQHLCEERYLLSSNKRRWTTYTLPNLFGEIIDEVPVYDSSSHKESSSSHKESSSSHKESSSSHNIQLILNKKRAKPEEIREAILEICSGKYMTLEELSDVLKRNAAGIRNRYLKQLVDEKKLIMRYRDKNHPDQGYMKAEV